MGEVTISAVVGEDRQLTISLPDDFPTGPVLVTITVLNAEADDDDEPLHLPPGAPDTSQLIEEGRQPR